MPEPQQNDPLDVDAQRRSRRERYGPPVVDDDQAADDAAAAKTAEDRTVDDHICLRRRSHRPG